MYSNILLHLIVLISNSIRKVSKFYMMKVLENAKQACIVLTRVSRNVWHVCAEQAQCACVGGGVCGEGCTYTCVRERFVFPVQLNNA